MVVQQRTAAWPSDCRKGSRNRAGSGGVEQHCGQRQQLDEPRLISSQLLRASSLGRGRGALVGVESGMSKRVGTSSRDQFRLTRHSQTVSVMLRECEAIRLASRTRCSVLPAMRSVVRYDAPQSRDPRRCGCTMDPGSAAYRHRASKTRVNALVAHAFLILRCKRRAAGAIQMRHSSTAMARLRAACRG